LGAELWTPFQKGRGGPGGWWILTEPELHFAEDVVVPDLAGWRRERMPEFQKVSCFTLAPDWLCEVLSPSTMRLDRTKKLRVYERERVPYVWLVDPIAQTVEVYELQDAELVLRANYGAQERIRAVPFDAVEIELADLWGESPA
jgi:Uma2 family endonuclease